MVRDVFASCYLVHGHPERSLLSKKCERLDAIFEQNVTLLPLKQREAASLLAAPTTLLSSATPENGSSSADAGGSAVGAPLGVCVTRKQLKEKAWAA
mgnify:CR=1 FL=1